MQFQRNKIKKSMPTGKAGFALLFLALFALTATGVRAGFEKQQQGSRGVALGNAGTALTGNTWSAFYNPALLAKLGRSVGAGYSPAPFGLKELASAAGEYNEPFSFGTLAASVQSYGFELYRETIVALSFAHSFDENLHVGATVNYMSLSLGKYGSDGFFSVDAGAAVSLPGDVTLGAFVTNINQPRIGVNLRERLPLVASIGAAWKPAEGLTVCSDVQKDIAYPLNLRVGVEYEPVSFIALRAGANTEPGRFSCGVGIKHAGVELDYSFWSHPDLGGTHGVSVSYVFAEAGKQ
jgi:hypothetical protein